MGHKHNKRNRFRGGLNINEIHHLLDIMLEQGFIKSNNNRYTPPITFIPKENNRSEQRFCYDFRKVNVKQKEKGKESSIINNNKQ